MFITSWNNHVNMDCFWLLSLVPTMLHHIVQQRHMGNVHSFTRMEGTIYKICLSAWGEPPKIYNICMYYQLLSLWTVSSSTKLYELYFPMDSEQQCTTRLCAKRVAISTESTYQYHIATLVCTIACDFFFSFSWPFYTELCLPGLHFHGKKLVGISHV